MCVRDGAECAGIKHCPVSHLGMKPSDRPVGSPQFVPGVVVISEGHMAGTYLV